MTINFPTDPSQSPWTNPDTGEIYVWSDPPGSWRRQGGNATGPGQYVLRDGDTMSGPLVQFLRSDTEPNGTSLLATNAAEDDKLEFRYQGSDDIVRCVTLPLSCCQTIVQRTHIEIQGTGGSGAAETGDVLEITENAILSPTTAIDSTQWQRETGTGTLTFVDIPGETGTSYTTLAGDLGLRIRVVQTFLAGEECEKVVSSNFIAIASVKPAGFGFTYTGGTVVVTVTLTANADVYVPAGASWNTVQTLIAGTDVQFTPASPGFYVIDSAAITAVRFSAVYPGVGSSYDAELTLDERSTLPVATDLSRMFYNLGAFNQDLDWLDVSNVTNMSYMLSSANVFNGDVSNWNVSNVTNMSYMFAYSSNFQQNISTKTINAGTVNEYEAWKTPLLTNINGFLQRASYNYLYDLSGWCVPLIPSAPYDWAEDTAIAYQTEYHPSWGFCAPKIVTSPVITTDSSDNPVPLGSIASIVSQGTSDPVASTVTYQWQRRLETSTAWQNSEGETAQTHVINVDDRAGYIRLRQTMDGANAYSNEILITSEYNLQDVLGDTWGNVNPGRSHRDYGALMLPGNLAYAVDEYSTTFPIVNLTSRTTSQVNDNPVGGNCNGRTEGNSAGLGYNDKMYIQSTTCNTIGVMDLNTFSVTRFSISGSPGRGWNGGCTIYSPHDGMLYGAGLNTNVILRIDPTTDTATYFGNLGGDFQYWSEGTLAKNQKIYLASRSSSSQGILMIDPFDLVGGFPRLTVVNTSAGADWAGGTLAPNGKIYWVPNSAWNNKKHQVLEFNPATNSVAFFGNIQSGETTVLAPNGLIYSIPNYGREDPNIYEIDPVNRTTRSIATVSITSNFNDAKLMENGRILCFPQEGDYLELDFNFPAGPTWPLSGLPGDTLETYGPYHNRA